MLVSNAREQNIALSLLSYQTGQQSSLASTFQMMGASNQRKAYEFVEHSIVRGPRTYHFSHNVV
jgi:hypothetical protein